MTEGLETIDSASKEQLSWLAQQCPAGTGTCVYKARSIMAMLVPSVQYYNDLTICNNAGVYRDSGKSSFDKEDEILNEGAIINPENKIELHAGEIKIYPNPANDILNIINYKFETYKNCKIIIYDVSGREVLSNNFTNDKLKTIVLLGNLNNGSYNFKIFANHNLIYTDNLIVNH
jgi:hypothetical protein